jgi:hypothetical protein
MIGKTCAALRLAGNNVQVTVAYDASKDDEPIREIFRVRLYTVPEKATIHYKHNQDDRMQPYVTRSPQNYSCFIGAKSVSQYSA